MGQVTTEAERKLKTQEARVRKLANRRGHYITKSRAGWSIDNQGRYMLMECSMNIPVLGFRFDASLDEIEDYFRD